MQRTGSRLILRLRTTLFRVFSGKVCFPGRIACYRQVDLDHSTPTRPLPAPGWVRLYRFAWAALGFCGRAFLLKINLRQIDFVLLVRILLGLILDCGEAGSTFLFYLFKNNFLFLSHMLFDLFSAIFLRKHNNSRFDSLINVSLSERWRHYDNTRQSLLWKAIDTVIIVLVEHPKLKPLQLRRLLHACLELHLDWRLAQDHMQLQLNNCSSKSCKVGLVDGILK